jgi:hypothetical protein
MKQYILYSEYKAIVLSSLLIPLIWGQLSANAGEEDKKAFIQLDFIEEDSTKYVIARLNEFINDSIGMPIEEVDLYFYVERTFSLLPIGDIFNMTDEDGKVKVQFPSDLPGDTHGNVKVIVKLEDAEEYPDTETSRIIEWGVPTGSDEVDEDRSLWAAGANAPISLMLITNSLIVVAWGIIFYISYKIYLISRM